MHCNLKKPISEVLKEHAFEKHFFVDSSLLSLFLNNLITLLYFSRKLSHRLFVCITHLGHQTKQVLTVISKHQKISINVIQIPSEIAPSVEIFHIPNISVTILNKFSSDNGEENYLKENLQNVSTNTMMIFTDGSAQGNPGPARSGVLINKSGYHSLPIKLAKAITSCDINYEGEIEAIKLGRDHAFKNIGKVNSLFIYIDAQSAIKAIMAQSRDSTNPTIMIQ